MRSRENSIAAAAVLLFVSFITPVHGQDPATGSVKGRVLDESGGALPGVTLVLGSPGLSSHTTSTDAGGGFTFDGVGHGTYRLRAELPGFQSLEIDVAVAAGGQTARDLELFVARYTEQVTVTATREERALANVPGAVGVVDGATLDNARGVNLTEVLRAVPGVYAGDVSGVASGRAA